MYLLLNYAGQWLTIPRVRVIIFLIYVYSLMWASFPFFGWGGYDVEPFGLSCTLAWGKPDHGECFYCLIRICFQFVNFILLKCTTPRYFPHYQTCLSDLMNLSCIVAIAKKKKQKTS